MVLLLQQDLQVDHLLAGGKADEALEGRGEGVGIVQVVLVIVHVG